MTSAAKNAPPDAARTDESEEDVVSVVIFSKCSLCAGPRGGGGCIVILEEVSRSSDMD